MKVHAISPLASQALGSVLLSFALGAAQASESRAGVKPLAVAPTAQQSS